MNLLGTLPEMPEDLEGYRWWKPGERKQKGPERGNQRTRVAEKWEEEEEEEKEEEILKRRRNIKKKKKKKKKKY